MPSFIIYNIYINHRHFLPFRRADITASASLQRIRSGRPQLHTLRLVLAAISTRE